MRSLTKNSDTKKQKLRKVFDYTATYYKYQSIGSFVGGSQWDLYYAERIFISGYVRGNCYTYAVIFAYLANAVGYQVNVVSSGGHGWAEINNRVYDPDWVRADPYHSYFGMAYGTTGKLVPNYASSRVYVIEI
ncbi:MAG: transglutaminase-like domain-containing protein [Lachnospiraceae bacterium]|nr:transglutaminase-like domain-containing protein [Lachnospiraceae bacterium]